MIEKVKAWLFPAVITILWMMVWQDIQEVKSDLKEYMSQTTISKTRLEDMDRRVTKMETRVFGVAVSLPLSGEEPFYPPSFTRVVALRPEGDEQISTQSEKKKS